MLLAAQMRPPPHRDPKRRDLARGDDTLCPPEIGRWLAEMFRAKAGVKVHFRDDDVGFGHFTYSRGEFAEPGGSMVKALLDGCG